MRNGNSYRSEHVFYYVPNGVWLTDGCLLSLLSLRSNLLLWRIRPKHHLPAVPDHQQQAHKNEQSHADRHVGKNNDVRAFENPHQDQRSRNDRDEG